MLTCFCHVIFTFLTMIYDELATYRPIILPLSFFHSSFLHHDHDRFDFEKRQKIGNMDEEFDPVKIENLYYASAPYIINL